MAVNLSPVGGVAAQFFDNDGNVLSGGKIYTYVAGTSTPTPTYTTAAGNIAHSNPIVLDSGGRVPTGEIWLTDGVLYKFVLKDSGDALIATYDNISGINSNAVAYTNQQEIITATAGQTVFNLTITYAPGTNSLSVFVDGVNQYGPGAQYAYTETDGNTVTFNSGLHVGAEVKFTSTQQQGAGAVDSSQVTYDPPFTGSVPTNVEAKLAQYLSVKDFGAVGDGVVDDTVAIQDAVSAARTSSKSLFFPAGTYLITDTIVLASNLLAGVSVYGESAWYGVTNSLIVADMNQVMLECSGIIGAPSNAPSIENIALRNNNSGVNNIVVNAAYSGGLRMKNVFVRTGNIGIGGVAEVVSSLFDNVCIDSASLGKYGYWGFFRNATFLSGRIYAMQRCWYFTGFDSVQASGVNCEFSQIIVSHDAGGTANFTGCHFETSECLLTNSQNPPINTGGAWVNNSVDGTGITGCVTFKNCFIATVNSNTNLVTIKSQAGFVYKLAIEDCTVVATNPIVGSSFAPGSAVALPSGTAIYVSNTGGLNVQVPPVNAFSGYQLINTDASSTTRVSKLRADSLIYQGNWVPQVLDAAIGGNAASITVNYAQYAQIGSIVTASFQVTINSTSGMTGGNAVYITLPVTPTTSEYPGVGTLKLVTGSSAGGLYETVGIQTTGRAAIEKGGNATDGALIVSDITGTTYIQGQLSYIVI